MADFLDEKKREIAERLKELRPLVEEFNRLEAAQRALEGVGAEGRARASSPATTPRRRRPTGGGSSSGGNSGRRGRPRGTGTRAKEALALVQEQPGITIPELAERMGIKQNYLYRVLPSLEQEGLVSKEGRGWHPKVAA
jgi:predicted Rossmann fold nucleotide-binding protein DprA/Smf involved in DNA uptake